MNILILNGHGAGDSGALGNGYKEADLTRELADLVVFKLNTYAKVYRYPRERNAYKDIKNGVFTKCLPVAFDKIDYAFEIHFNAFDGNAKGTEIYITKLEKGYSVEQAIVNNIASIGFSNRGVKRSDFLVIKTLKNKGVSSALLETCFIDNANDMKTYQEHKNDIAQAIVNGIVERFGLNGTSKPVEPTPPQPARKTVAEIAREVINGAWGNGQDRTNRLTNAGYNPSEVQAEVNRQLGAKPTPPSKPSNNSKPLGTYEVIASDLSVRTGPGENYRRKTYNELTADAKKHDYDKDGCINRGTRVTVKEWKNGFARIPSGWVSGDYLKKV